MIAEKLTQGLAGMLGPRLQQMQSHKQVPMLLAQNTGCGGGARWVRGLGKSYRGGSKPNMVSEKGSQYHEWKIELMADLRLCASKRIDECMDSRQTQKEDITEDVADLKFQDGPNERKRCVSILCLEPMVCCAGLAVFAIEEAKGGNGLEAMRKLMQRFEPRTALRKRAHLRVIISRLPVGKLQELETKILRLRTHEAVPIHGRAIVG